MVTRPVQSVMVAYVSMLPTGQETERKEGIRD